MIFSQSSSIMTRWFFSVALVHFSQQHYRLKMESHLHKSKPAARNGPFVGIQALKTNFKSKFLCQMSVGVVEMTTSDSSIFEQSVQNFLFSFRQNSLKVLPNVTQSEDSVKYHAGICTSLYTSNCSHVPLEEEHRYKLPSAQ